MAQYVVLDTNVLVSAVLARHDNSAPVQILTKIMEGTVTLLLSREILAEYNEVLRRKKFSFAETDIANIINTLMIGCVIIEPESTGETIADAKDLPFYEMLMDSRCKGAFLITGNTKHFPQNFYIVTPRQMLDIILQQ